MFEQVGTPINVLILEDKADDAELMVIELKKAGFQPTWQVISGETEYVSALVAQPDLILADYALPQFDADRALRLLKERRLDIPFIVVTGSLSEEAAVGFMKDGAADYLLKDRLSRLGPAVQHALAETTLRRRHQQALMALRISEENFRTVFHESLDIILVIDGKDGRILDVNRRVHQLLGYTVEALIDRHFSYLFSQADSRESEVVLSEVRTYGAVFESQNFRRADGGTTPMDLTATMITWNGSSAILATLRDVTDRRHAEEALRAAELLNVQLENEKELNELKTRFISMVSHEYRTPLTTILTSTDILQRYTRQMTDSQRHEHYQRIRESVVTMVELLDQVLFLGRMEGQRQVFVPKPLDLNRLCERLVDEIRLNAGGAIHIDLSVTGSPQPFEADAGLMRQIITNLLTNAVKYSPSGGGIRVELNWGDQQVTLRVIDQGIGIPQEDQARLFQTFHRAANAASFPGTGLGLSITRKAVELHGGTITFESAENSGTTFTVCLPLRRDPDGLMS